MATWAVVFAAIRHQLSNLVENASLLIVQSAKIEKKLPFGRTGNRNLYSGSNHRIRALPGGQFPAFLFGRALRPTPQRSPHHGPTGAPLLGRPHQSESTSPATPVRGDRPRGRRKCDVF